MPMYFVVVSALRFNLFAPISRILNALNYCFDTRTLSLCTLAFIKEGFKFRDGVLHMQGKDPVLALKMSRMPIVHVYEWLV